MLSYKEQKQSSNPCGSQGSELKQEKLVFEVRCDILAQEKPKLVSEVKIWYKQINNLLHAFSMRMYSSRRKKIKEALEEKGGENDG